MTASLAPVSWIAISWKLNGITFDETLEHSGQIIKISGYDKPSDLSVTSTQGMLFVMAADMDLRRISYMDGIADASTASAASI